MVTRLLRDCGLYLGPDDVIMQASESDNPDGYWENQEIANFNDELLTRLGGTWREVPAIEPGWHQHPDYDVFKYRVNALLLPYDDHETWGWKDPRNTLTLAFWLDLFPDANLLLVVRNPMEVARSLSTGAAMRDLDYGEAVAL
ncbi:MAG: hypothetical protein AAF653_14480, partial [Chloroflexota bacterium]